MDLDLRPFEGPITDPDLHAAFNRFDRLMLAEEEPTFAPRRLTETAAMLSDPPGAQRRLRWFVVEGGDIVGAALLDMDTEDVANLHLGWCVLQVLPNRRRRGIGRRLARAVGAATVAAGRRVVMGETTSLVPAGAGFAAAIGAEPGLAAETSELPITDIDEGSMDDWIARGETQGDRFRLFWVEGPWPEELRPAVVGLGMVMNDAPFGELDFNEQQQTVEHLTAFEAELESREISRLSAVLEERSTRRLVGFTQVFINPSFPDLLQQGDTGVFPEFRGLGLGKWLKAAMASRVMAEHPEITRIRTENASANAPMLAINHAMGFRLHHTNTVWQIAAAQLAGAGGE